MRGLLSLLLVFITSSNILPVVYSTTTITGKPHSTVQDLTEDNFDEALNDPANGLWLLKFYAPWCGHCKKLAPLLDKMASYISGKFAIGKIDCTTQKTICKSPQFNIRGYPTLQIYKDGHFYDYTGKRDPDSMIDFMEKMSLPSVTLVTSYEDFVKNVLDTSSNGVAFVAFDSNGKEELVVDDVNVNQKKVVNSADVTPVEKILSSSTFLQMYGQSSRVLQSVSTFALLHPKHESELKHFFGNNDENPKSQVILRIEKEIEPIVYKNNNDDNLPLSSSVVLDWMKEISMPLVTELEGHNFRSVTSLGKPLLIGVVNPDDDGNKHESFVKELRDFAQDGPMEITKKYKVTEMNGKKFHNFLKQFNISSDSRLPQAIVVDVQNRTFYQNDTYVTVNDFIARVEDGTIEKQQSAETNQNMLKKIRSWFIRYMPYSVILVTVLTALICWFAIIFLGDEGDVDGFSSSSSRRVVMSESQLEKLQNEVGKEKKLKSKSLKED